jgi:hypothetical protein
MIYTKPLPRLDNIVWLAKHIDPFPITAGEILDIAQTWKFNKSILEFLKLFPADEEFESRADFLTRVEELEIMIREEREMPVEILRSPLD